MTQQEKQLLLKDLCARLPYGVMIYLHTSSDRGSTIVLNSSLYGFIEDVLNNSPYEIKEIKPYLRPLSSMTEEERKELSIILNYEFYADGDFALVAEDDRHRIRLELCGDYIDWLNKKMFDYRGLIPMGLALESKEGMYKTE